MLTERQSPEKAARLTQSWAEIIMLSHKAPGCEPRATDWPSSSKSLARQCSRESQHVLMACYTS